MNQGHSAAWDQQWDQAARYYRLALQACPDHPSALTSLGLALYELSDYSHALQTYQRAAQVEPTDPVPVEKMSQIYERQGQIRKAVLAGMQAAELYLKARDVEKSVSGWIRVLSLDPENQMARTRLALIYEKLGRQKEAIHEYVGVASLMQRANEPEKGYQVLRHCLQLVPGNIEAQQALSALKAGQLLPKPGRPRGGNAPAAPHAVELPPAQPASEALDPVAAGLKLALSQLADMLFEQADDPATFQSLSGRKSLTALTSGGESTAGAHENGEQMRIMLHLGQAIDSQSKQDFHQAAVELERAVEIGLNRPAASYDLGLLLAESDPQKALRHLQKAVLHPDYALAAYLLMAQIFFGDGDYASAAGNYLQALRLADEVTVPARQRSELRQLYEPVIEAQVRETNPETLKRLCETIAEQVLRPDWQDYLKMARSQMDDQPEGVPPLPLAEMLLESRSSQVIEAQATIRRISAKGQLRSAMEEAFYALQFAPTYLPLHIQIGDLLLKEGRIQAAVEKYLLVAELYSLRGEAAMAIQLLTRITEIAPTELKVRDRLIELLVDRGRVDEAIGQYTELAEAHFRQAELELARQTYQAALRLARQAPDARRRSLEILQKIADIDLQQLDFRQAARVYEQIRTLQPEDAATRARLIDLHFRLGQDGDALNEVNGFLSLLEAARKRDQAIAFMLTQVAEQPDKLELRRRLADLYRLDHQVEKAVEQLDAIADALLAAGNPAGVRRTVESILALKPANAADYEAILSSLPPA